jgi:methylenetetrahydrofolate reductase (NADPH)
MTVLQAGAKMIAAALSGQHTPMRIRDLIDAAQKSGNPVVSFEFFPPKTDEAVAGLFHSVQELGPLQPTFVSVTYGAGGSTRRKTLELVTRIKQETGIEAMAHLTCVGHSRDELRRILDQIVAAGIENVLALRGDPPQGETEFRPVAGGFTHASELVAFIRELGAPLCLGAACYPETHPQAASPEADLANLKRKVEAGADFLITQLFFDNSDYFAFVKRAQKNGIGVPILAGIMPIQNYKQIQRFTLMCGASIPPWLVEELEAVKDNAEAVAGVGISYAIDQCRELRRRGVPGLHFYTLNRSPATRAILARLRHTL